MKTIQKQIVLEIYLSALLLQIRDWDSISNCSKTQLNGRTRIDSWTWPLFWALVYRICVLSLYDLIILFICYVFTLNVNLAFTLNVNLAGWEYSVVCTHFVIPFLPAPKSVELSHGSKHYTKMKMQNFSLKIFHYISSMLWSTGFSC